MTKPSLKTGIYRHYKGGLYEVLGVAFHCETLERTVVYQALHDSKEFGANALWVRPLDSFLSSVVIDGKEQPRFEFILEAVATSTAHH